MFTIFPPDFLFASYLPGQIFGVNRDIWRAVVLIEHGVGHFEVFQNERACIWQRYTFLMHWHYKIFLSLYSLQLRNEGLC